MFDDEKQRFDRGLPLRKLLFSLRKLLDISGGILERDELAAVWQRDRIAERLFPPLAANGANPSCRIRSESDPVASALPMVDRDSFHTPSRSPRTESISLLPNLPGLLPRIILRSDLDHASRAKGVWSDPARVVHYSPRAGPFLVTSMRRRDHVGGFFLRFPG